MGLIKNMFNPEAKHFSKAEKLADEVEAFAKKCEELSDEELKNNTNRFKEALKNGKTLEDILPEAYATIREAAKRVIGEYPYHVQIVGGVLLNYGDIAEMKTGEGKTLTATMPIYLNALEGKGAHIITVNEYLASRDANWMGEIYRFLGLTVGCNLRELSQEQKKAAFACDITYTTNSELGFDYLRDNMVVDINSRVLRGLHYALIDEVDSVLIDEARTPLIISGFGETLDQYYIRADQFAKSLRRDVDVNVSKEDNAVNLTETGIKKAEKFFNIDHIFAGNNAELVHYIQNALRANFLMSKEVEYIVSDGEIVLVDQFTGRKMEGREFSNGVHQAIQAKENVGIKNESKTLATITYQNFFRLYDKLSGMTGTAKTEEKEFINTYNMRVFEVPTNRPIARNDYPDEVFNTRSDKYTALIQEVSKLYEKGQPVLVGTLSVGMSETLSAMMKKQGIPHQVLNAKEDAKEAQIIAQAGQRKTVTIATNMAGRGTDIKLGEGVVELGGLVVLGTERHESKRIDNQLRGRSGRQGDPGYSRFYVCEEDDLIEKFATDLGKEAFEQYQKGSVGVDKMRNFVDNIQLRAEGLHFDSRKNVLEFDDVLMEQRRMIYSQRDEVLAMDNISSVIENLLNKKIKEDKNILKENKNEQNVDSFKKELMLYGLDENSANSIIDKDDSTISKTIWDTYQNKIKDYEEEAHNMEKRVFLYVLDRQWIDHVDNMDRVKNGINLQSYAQIKPIDAFKQEAFERFNNMMQNIVEQSLGTILNVQIKQESNTEEN